MEEEGATKKKHKKHHSDSKVNSSVVAPVSADGAAPVSADVGHQSVQTVWHQSVQRVWHQSVQRVWPGVILHAPPTDVDVMCNSLSCMRPVRCTELCCTNGAVQYV